MVELMTVMDMRYIIVRNVNGKLTMILKQEIEFSSDYASVTDLSKLGQNNKLINIYIGFAMLLYQTLNIFLKLTLKPL